MAAPAAPAKPAPPPLRSTPDGARTWLNGPRSGPPRRCARGGIRTPGHGVLSNASARADSAEAARGRGGARERERSAPAPGANGRCESRVREAQTWSRRSGVRAGERESGRRGSRRRRSSSGGRRMESWQPLKEEVDSTHSLHSSATRLSMRREDSDLSEFPSVEEGMLIICEDDGKEWAEEASCTPFLATEDRSTSFCIPLLESSLTPRVWNETLLQESELEFTPLRGIPDLSEVSEPDSRQPQVMEALCQSSERLSDMGPRRASPQETTRSRNVHFLQQQGKSQSAASPETGGKLLTSYGSDSVQTQASPKSLRRWPTSLPTGQGPSGPTEDGAASLDHRISHAFISPCLETNGLGFSSSLASSLCERYKNLEEYKMKSKLDCLQSDESQVKRLGEVDSPLPKGELSSKFTSHSLCPGASQGQSVQNPPGPHVSSVKFPGHSDSPRTGSSGVTFPSSTHHSVRFKLDDGPKSGPKEGLDANETLAFHEIVASIEPTASKNPTAIQNLLDWKQHISPLSQTEKTSSGQLPQPVYQSTPVVIPAQNFTPQVPLRVIPAPSKVQPPFVSPNEELPQPSPRNLAACKSQTPSQNQDGSSGSSEKTLIDLPFVLPLNQAFSPTLMNILRRDISRGFISQGETSQLRVTFKDHELQTKVVPENDGSAQGPWLDENGIIFSGRVAEMLRDEKYNVSGVPETKEPLQTIPLSSVAPGSCSAYADQFRDGPSEASIPPLTFPQAKLDKSTSTTDNEPESVEPLLVGTELRRYRDRPSQAPPEKEASHCFIDSHPSVPATTSVPVQVEESQSLSPDPLRIFYRSPRFTSNAWCLKLNLATECGDCMTELNEADLRKVEEIKAGMFGCGKPLDLFQGLPCPVGIRNISETCDHFFIEAHENGCFRPMGNEQFGNSCREFRSNEYAEMSQTQPMASWTTRCGSHAKSVLQTSQAKAWSFSRSGSHQPFLSSTSDESHYASRESPRSLHEEMETKEVESVGPVAVSSREPISLPSRPPSRSCSEAFRHSLCCPSAPVVVQSDRGQSLPAVTWRANRPMSKSPLPISNTILATSIRKDPGLMGNHHDRASGDLSAVTTSLKEKESPAAPAITTTAKPQSSVKESQLLDKQDLARGVSLKSLGIHDKGIRVTAEFPPSISPKEQAEHCQPRSVPPVDNVVGPEHSLRTPLSQHQASPVEREDQLKQKVHSLIVANVEAESSMTVRPNSPTLEGEASPVPSSVLSPKQRAVSYLRITLSPKASNAKLDDEILKKRQHESDSGTRTGLDSLSTSKSRCLVPLEPAPQELAIIPLSDKEEFVNGIYHKTSQPSKSFSRHIQVNIADLDAYSKRVQNTQGRVTSDNLRNASSDTPLKLSSDAVTQITTESPGKTTLSSEIFINSQPHSILKKPSHCPTAQFSLLPYKPPGSAEMYYVPHLTEPLEYPVAKSDTTLESTHSGSNDAIAPEFPPDALGTRDENVCDIVTIKHKEGIYSKKTACKSAWTEEQNPPPEKATESKNHLELENTTHSVFKSAQFYFHHPVHHQHDHDFSCCEPWGRGTCRTHSRRDFFPYTDKDSSFCPPYETSADEHRFLPLRTDVDYSRVERYHWNVMGDRVPRAWQRPEENLQGGSKVSAARETAPRPLEPSLSLSELWNRFQERQKQQKLPESRSSDDLSLVERLDRLAKILQKPMMLSLQASKSARDDHKGESARQQLRRKHQSKRDPSDKSRSPPRSSCRLLGGDPVTLIPAQHSGLDSVSLISSDSRPSPEPAEPASESDVSAQTDGDMGPLEEVSSNVSFAGPARTVQAKTYEASKRQQKPLSERQREGSKKVAKWKKTPPASQVRRRVLQVEYVISSDSFSTTSSAWSSSSSPKEKHNIRMLNKGVQTGELEIVRTTRKHTRDFGVTFPTPKYKATGTRGDSRVNNSSPGSNLEDEKPLTIYMWTKKPRRSKPLCCEGVSWFIPAENPRQAKKENQPGWVPGPGPSWFAPLISSKPWRQPLREKNWQTESSSGRQAEPPGLHQDKETPARFMKAGLQESLERLRPDFISRSRARVKRLRLITEERKLQRLLQKERDQLFNTEEQQKESRDMAGFLSKKGYVTVRNRIITKKEMVQRSKRMYEQLPEVRKRREEEQRKSVYSTYRYRAQLYKMKITNRVLGRKVPWD
ncbi:centrosome-associated protein ALMS1 isoform X9 [Sminthopsis crassicaudata]|uniref:centrosome-associated protein ALMS1 isoform X9 n=2 Tax=Sminthopsis crassicaudata TaxID=9301 RepID=UPI003D685B6A